jgi:hypothetical protein
MKQIKTYHDDNINRGVVMGDNDILHILKAFETIIRVEKIKNVRINDFL